MSRSRSAMHDSMEAVCAIASSPSLSSRPSPRSAGASMGWRAEATAGIPRAGVRGEEALDGEADEDGASGDPEDATEAGEAGGVAVDAVTVDRRALSAVESRRRVSPSRAGPVVGSLTGSAWRPSGGVRGARSAVSSGCSAAPGARSSTAVGLADKATGAGCAGSCAAAASRTAGSACAPRSSASLVSFSWRRRCSADRFSRAGCSQRSPSGEWKRCSRSRSRETIVRRPRRYSSTGMWEYSSRRSRTYSV